MQQKRRIPEPAELLNQLISPEDISASVLEDIQILAQSNVDDLRKEFERREKLDNIKGALENQDYDLLREIYEEMYGENMISAGKQMIISYLALNGVRVKDETHVAETVGQWIENVYETTGLEGLYDLATNIDVAMQVVNEYQVVFDSEIARQNKKNEFTTPEMVEVEWSELTGNSMEDDFIDTNFDLEEDNEDDEEDDEDTYIGCVNYCLDLSCDGEKCNPKHPDYVTPVESNTEDNESKIEDDEDNEEDEEDTGSLGSRFLHNVSFDEYPF